MFLIIRIKKLNIRIKYPIKPKLVNMSKWIWCGCVEQSFSSKIRIDLISRKSLTFRKWSWVTNTSFGTLRFSTFTTTSLSWTVSLTWRSLLITLIPSQRPRLTWSLLQVHSPTVTQESSVVSTSMVRVIHTSSMSITIQIQRVHACWVITSKMWIWLPSLKMAVFSSKCLDGSWFTIAKANSWMM